MIEHLPPRPVGGTDGTLTSTPSHDSLPPSSICPFLTSCNDSYIDCNTGLNYKDRNEVSYCNLSNYLNLSLNLICLSS